MELINYRNQKLQCSHFEPEVRVADKLPCVVYLHGNSSSRVEALSCVQVLLKFNISVFCLDFSGSGKSDGEYVSLGYYERDDLAIVIEYLRQTDSVGCIGLWGRSMGAATALLHGDRDPSIAGMVLDSPFTSLRHLAEELVDVFIGVNLPKWIVSMALNLIRSSIKTKARFDINELSPISHVDKTFIPALFVAAESDTFIHPDHARKLHALYAGDKNLVVVEGDHNSARPKFFIDSVAIFFYNTLQCENLPKLSHERRGSGDSDILLRPLVSKTASQSFEMRPPDKYAWDTDLAMQKAIEESILHVAAEETPIDQANVN